MAKENTNNKIDIIIPAYKAQGTLRRTLASILMQTIKDDLHVIIVDDATPNNREEYDKIACQFRNLGLDIVVKRLEVNAGPGVARQVGIEEGKNQFFTCIDADDTFSSALSLEIMREGMKQENPQFPADSIKCVSAGFMQLGEETKQMLPHLNDMVWMFGKLYRRKFIEDYGIKFNETRANEDTGYNKWVQLLCSNANEQIRFLQDIVYLWHNKNNSITRINDGQYALDQCFCGWTDNMIYAIENVRKKRPFDGNVMQTIASVMLQLYYYWIETYAKKPVFAEQNWEYVKKFYHTCYKKIEEGISEEALAEMFSMASMAKYQDGSMIGIIPCMGIKEFFDKLHTEEYDENKIYEIWTKMKENPETRKLMQNNIDCGVCVYNNLDFSLIEE
jgi:glycosyltransferase involved in cell wall biosynthesis